ncbi:MAG: hypothetical protein V1854_05070 [Methanobacteriota archaeon]
MTRIRTDTEFEAYQFAANYPALTLPSFSKAAPHCIDSGDASRREA